jgi:membrane-bound lytic murein transglycosylase B
MYFKKYGLFLFLFFFGLATCYFLLTTDASAQMTEAQIQEQEAKWRAELEATEKEIAEWEAVLKQTKQGTASLERDAKVLQAKINEAKAFIRQRQIQIEQLTRDISLKNKTIVELEEKINRGKESLASILRSTNEIDTYSLAEVLLSNKNISNFFEDIDSYDSIKKSLEAQFNEIRELQDKTSKEKEILDQKRSAEADKKAEIETQKKKVELDEKEKQKLISINKTQEKTYAQVIAEKQKKAAQIRAALFSLRDTEGIPFGDALKFATLASEKTGVRPALILAILTQESDLGRNQGSCLVSNLDTGDGAGKNTGTLFEQVMKAPRDTVPFKDITERLGKDWKMTPVSCPPGTKWSASRGYGGGMGPSQFIPSTWELFKGRIGDSIGVKASEANPWNPQHSIMATAIYLSDLGAGSGGYTVERNAACRYYSGAACSPGRRPANVFYGDQVMANAQNIQLTMIDPLEGF